MSYTADDVMAKLGTIQQQLVEQRRMLNDLDAKIRASVTEGPAPQHTPDGLFLPGSGTLGDRGLSDAAQASLAQLDAQDAP